MRSISQIARELGYSHTAIGNAIAKIESETGSRIGQASGNGRARMINDEEYELIKAKCPKKIPKRNSLTITNTANTGFIISTGIDRTRQTIEAELVDEQQRSADQYQQFRNQLATFTQVTQDAQATEDAELFADLERYRQKLLMARQAKERMKAEILYGKVND
jgi:biotin operon repressor